MFRNFGGTSTQRFQKAREYVTGASEPKSHLCSAFVLWILAPSAFAQ
jgi:hypothetical protein